MEKNKETVKELAEFMKWLEERGWLKEKANQSVRELCACKFLGVSVTPSYKEYEAYYKKAMSKMQKIRSNKIPNKKFR